MKYIIPILIILILLTPVVSSPINLPDFIIQPNIEEKFPSYTVMNLGGEWEVTMDADVGYMSIFSFIWFLFGKIDYYDASYRRVGKRYYDWQFDFGESNTFGHVFAMNWKYPITIVYGEVDRFDEVEEFNEKNNKFIRIVVDRWR